MNRILLRGMKWLHFVTRPISGIWLHNSQRNRVIVLFEDEILLVCSSFGVQDWSLPGGGKRKSESSKKAASRELSEETGIKVKEDQLTSIGRRRLPEGKRWPSYEVEFFVLKLTKKPQIKTSSGLEIVGIDWFSLKAPPKERSKTVDVGLSLLA